MVLEAVIRSGRALADLLEGVSLYPQTMINVPLAPGLDWAASPRLAEQKAKVEVELGRTGRVLIRGSGTEPVVRVMVESEDAERGRRCAEQLAAALR